MTTPEESEVLFLDPPARIAILGAGPIGLEAALYARYLGYEVTIYERGQVAEQLLQMGHVRMFTPFRLNRSPLALAALRAQDENWRPPAEDSLLTAREYAEQYLVPLAQSDLLADHLQLHTEVLAIGRANVTKQDMVGDVARADSPFRLLLRDADGKERTVEADAVIDCTGVWANPLWLGAGGIPALGELAAAPHIEYGLPDVLDQQREKYARRHTLVIGNGDDSAHTVTALADLGHQVPDTWITWITPPDDTEDAASGPIPSDPLDPFPERQRVVLAANRLTQGDADHVTHWPGTTVERIEYQPEAARFVVQLQGKHPGELSVERIIANVGHRPNTELWRELQVKTCFATEGSLRLATSLAGIPGRAELANLLFTPETVESSEPYFYVLGAKSFGRNPEFLIWHGLQQVRLLFAILGDRADLDLYKTAICKD